MNDDEPLPITIDEARSKGLWVLIALVVIPILAALVLTWGDADAAVSRIYWRVQLMQGSSAIGYGQGATQDAAWSDCQRLAAITRAMTAAETRSVAVAAVVQPTVRYCRSPIVYQTVEPEVTRCALPPPPRPGTCPAGTSGSWTQTATMGPPPTCAVIWSSASAGDCVPVSTEPTADANDVPLTWTQGGDLTKLMGYLLVYGTSPNYLPRQIDNIPPSARSYIVRDLAPGTYYFALMAKGPCTGTRGSPVDPWVCQDSWLSNLTLPKVIR